MQCKDSKLLDIWYANGRHLRTPDFDRKGKNCIFVRDMATEIAKNVHGDAKILYEFFRRLEHFLNGDTEKCPNISREIFGFQS